MKSSLFLRTSQDQVLEQDLKMASLNEIEQEYQPVEENDAFYYI